MSAASGVPRLLGVPLKYVTLVALTVQNSALAIVMHQSRVATSPAQTYFAPTAVLLSELFKCIISVGMALWGIDQALRESERGAHLPMEAEEGRSSVGSARGNSGDYRRQASMQQVMRGDATAGDLSAQEHAAKWMKRLRELHSDVFSSDCWKLSIPAVLYVVQNNLQYVAATNLDPTTFQVAYQLKILTTALFSVVLLRRRLGPEKWIALLVLTVGVGIVQIQTKEAQALIWGGGPPSSFSGQPLTGGNDPTSAGPISQHPPPPPPGPFDSHRAYPPPPGHDPHAMDPVIGFFAVITACLTSGLAGVYFEKVLKDSSADLWVRNVQLSSFSLIPALVPVAVLALRSGLGAPLAHFGGWARATVAMQVVGGLVTALVIKHADNILKGFAVSFSIVLSFLASMACFGYQATPAFLIGATLTISSTIMYNRSERAASAGTGAHAAEGYALAPTEEEEGEYEEGETRRDGTATQKMAMQNLGQKRPL